MFTSSGAGDHEFSIDARERLLSEAERIARMGSFAWHVPTGTIHWSDELFRIFGREPQATAPTAEEFFAAIHPEDLAQVRAVAEHGVRTGVAAPVEFRIVLPDGSFRPVLMNGAALLDEAGQPTRFVGTLMDITERVRVDRERARRELVLRQAQRVAHVGSFEWTPEAGEMRWSDELRRICQVDRDAPASVDRLAAMVHADDRDAFDDLCTRALASDSPSLECRLVRSDGTIRQVRIHVRSFHDERGNRVGIIGSVHDVTELRALETQLLQSQKMDALGRLAGGIAHDFNNLLTVIGLHVARLRREPSEASLTAIAKAVEHATSLTQQLLAFSRQSALTMRAVELASLVADATNMVGRLFASNIDLVYDAPLESYRTDGDPAQLTQVLMNLLLNARDALPDGGKVVITLGRRTLAARASIGGVELMAGEYVAIAIHDDGIGMDDAVRSRMFEPFFTTKEVGRGTGLGLSMVFGIVSQLRGAIEVDSSIGRGTTITVLLPRSRRDSRAPAEPIPTPIGIVAGESILLVDDETPLRDALRDVLCDAGYVVRSAADGESALRAFAEAPDATTMIISDVLMPGLSGPEVVARIRAQKPTIPVLFISGHAPDSRTMALDDSCTSFLRKPFAPAELVSTVRDSLARARAR